MHSLLNTAASTSPLLLDTPSLCFTTWWARRRSPKHSSRASCWTQCFLISTLVLTSVLSLKTFQRPSLARIIVSVWPCSIRLMRRWLKSVCYADSALKFFSYYFLNSIYLCSMREGARRTFSSDPPSATLCAGLHLSACFHLPTDD